jgi:hypothetical protein
MTHPELVTVAFIGAALLGVGFALGWKVAAWVRAAQDRRQAAYARQVMASVSFAAEQFAAEVSAQACAVDVIEIDRGDGQTEFVYHTIH